MTAAPLRSLEELLDTVFTSFCPTLDLTAELIRQRAHVQEILVLLLARLDALACSTVPEETSRQRPSSRLWQAMGEIASYWARYLSQIWTMSSDITGGWLRGFYLLPGAYIDSPDSTTRSFVCLRRAQFHSPRRMRSSFLNAFECHSPELSTFRQEKVRNVSRHLLVSMR
jgi:hypothetical protein